jgi:tetratricopeptide (TPR) repeat protein
VHLCYQRRQWENAARIGEAIVAQYADQHTDEELAELHVHIGLCEQHVAQREVATRRLRELLQRTGHGVYVTPEALRDAAEAWASTVLEPGLLATADLAALTKVIRQMERALRRVPEHPRALEVLAALTMSRGDWDRSLRYLDRAVDALGGRSEERARLLLCAADIAANKLLSVQRARRYCEAAVRCLPDSEQIRRRAEDLLDPGKAAPSDTMRTTVDLIEPDTQVLLVGGAASRTAEGAPGSEREDPTPRVSKSRGGRGRRE